MKPLRALLVNPYIYDFAAYNFWSSPLGLLYMGGILRQNGFQIDLIDCMEVAQEKRKADGRGPFMKEKVAKPEALKGIRKHFKRYGITAQNFMEKLSSVDEPDLILVTSIMTYWYPGAEEVIRLARERYPRARIVAGGIYPTLCRDLAESAFKDADLIVTNKEMEKFYHFIEEAFSIVLREKPLMNDLDILPYPAYDLYDHIAFVPLLTSTGCAFRCTYCATPYMYPRIVRRSPSSALDEIEFWKAARGVTKFIIYDDSFLYKKEVYAKPLLKGIARLPFDLEFYNPNAVNAAFIDAELAELLVAAGFREVRIGLESVNPVLQKETGGKVNPRVFEKALAELQRAGFKRDDIHIYILAGLPLQKWEEVKEALDYIFSLGARPYIAEYTPIPHTVMFEQYRQHARYPVAQDALFQNNALFPFAWEGFTEEDLSLLKRYARRKLQGP